MAPSRRRRRLVNERVRVLNNEYQQEMTEKTLGLLGGLLDRLEQARIAK